MPPPPQQQNDAHRPTMPNPEPTRRRAAVTAHGVCRNVAGIRRMPSPQQQKRRSSAHDAEPRTNAQARCCYGTRRVPTTETPPAAGNSLTRRASEGNETNACGSRALARASGWCAVVGRIYEPMTSCGGMLERCARFVGGGGLMGR